MGPRSRVRGLPAGAPPMKQHALPLLTVAVGEFFFLMHAAVGEDGRDVYVTCQLLARYAGASCIVSCNARSWKYRRRMGMSDADLIFPITEGQRRAWLRRLRSQRLPGRGVAV